MGQFVMQSKTFAVEIENRGAAVAPIATYIHDWCGLIDEQFGLLHQQGRAPALYLNTQPAVNPQVPNAMNFNYLCDYSGSWNGQLSFMFSIVDNTQLRRARPGSQVLSFRVACADTSDWVDLRAEELLNAALLISQIFVIGEDSRPPWPYQFKLWIGPPNSKHRIWN
jgi:hypothetical protein